MFDFSCSCLNSLKKDKENYGTQSGLRIIKKTRTTKVEHKAPGMCGQEYVWSRICVDRPTYRQSEMSKD